MLPELDDVSVRVLVAVDELGVAGRAGAWRWLERVLHLAGLECPDATLTPGPVSTKHGMSLPPLRPASNGSNGNGSDLNGDGHGVLTPQPRMQAGNGEPNGNPLIVGS